MYSVVYKVMCLFCGGVVFIEWDICYGIFYVVIGIGWVWNVEVDVYLI